MTGGNGVDEGVHEDVVDARNIANEVAKREFKETGPNYPLPTQLTGIEFFIGAIDEHDAILGEILDLAKHLYNQLEAQTPGLSVQDKLYT